MKKPVLIGITVLGLAVAAVGVLYLVIDPNRFRDQIAGELQKQLHRPVTMGKMGLSLFPLAVRVDDLSIGERAGFPSNRPFAAARSIDVRADLFALLGGKITVDSLTLASPVIELAKNPAGEWNFADLTSQSGSGGKPVTLDLLKIGDGSIAVTDLRHPEARAVYQHLDIEVTDVAPGRRMAIKAGLKLPGEKGGALAFEGTGPAPFDGKLTATGASISGLTSFAGGTPTVDGALTGTTTIRSEKDKMTLSGHLDLANATAMSKPLGVPVAADFQVTDDGDTGILSASGLTLTAGKVAVRGAGQYDTRASTVSARMNVANAGLAEVLALARLFGGAEMEGTGTISLDLAMRGPISAPEYTGDGQLRDATVKLAALTKPLGIKSAAVRFDGRKAAISNLDASVAGTNIKGSVGVSNFAGNFAGPALTFDLDADKLDVAEWQKLPAATPASGTAKGSAPAPGISAKGNLHVGTLLSQGLQLTNVRAQAVYQNSQLTVSPLTAQLYGGTQTGSLVADLRPQTPTVALDLKLANVETNQLLSATSSLKNMLYGALAASGGLRMQLGAADMPRTLNGALNLNIANGRLAGTNILNELAQVGKFMG
ncbi:MAG TPA: AsmA family protein, partial [Bryobacteraceae bacterium]|nr:AsmA family protein [Bryobacteraceae bacterium]